MACGLRPWTTAPYLSDAWGPWCTTPRRLPIFNFMGLLPTCLNLVSAARHLGPWVLLIVVPLTALSAPKSLPSLAAFTMTPLAMGALLMSLVALMSEVMITVMSASLRPCCSNSCFNTSVDVTICAMTLSWLPMILTLMSSNHAL
eukprot:5883233-Pyramimonas_sp.AAC.1